MNQNYEDSQQFMKQQAKTSKPQPTSGSQQHGPQFDQQKFFQYIQQQISQQIQQQMQYQFQNMCF